MSHSINLGILEFRQGGIILLEFFSNSVNTITPSIIKTGKIASWITPTETIISNTPSITTNINNLIQLKVDKATNVTEVDLTECFINDVSLNKILDRLELLNSLPNPMAINVSNNNLILTSTQITRIENLLVKNIVIIVFQDTINYLVTDYT